ncbi:MAG: sugar phosphate isomerase/epimerase [Verrucomicrobiota bacterium]
MSAPHDDLRIGTLVPVQPASHTAPELIRQLLPHGFESFQLTAWQDVTALDLPKLAEEVRAALADSGAVISALGVYGNPLGRESIDEATRQSWRRLIDNAPLFGCDLVAGFAGGVVGGTVPESIPRFREVFTELAAYAADRSVRLAFENCRPRGSHWEHVTTNIAFNPDAWELMFNAVPAANLGLEWEPCHQMVQFIDPLPQIMAWKDRLFHLHGKDATVRHDYIRRHGVSSAEMPVWHRTPGFGDSNWTDLISELRRAGFRGAIDIEGFHDPVYKDELEMVGQVRALAYLKQCRGGDAVPSPYQS